MFPSAWAGFLQIDKLFNGCSHQLGLSALSLFEPTILDIKCTLERGNKLGFNHVWTGSTQSGLKLSEKAFPGHKSGLNFLVPRWQVDHKRKQVGKGKDAYNKAAKALRSWKHMDLGWTKIHADPPAQGNLVCVLPHLLVAWMKLPLKVSYVEDGRCSAKGKDVWRGQQLKFAHSTLQGHALAGEERFALEWHDDDDSVWYDIYTVSRPATPLAAISYPVIRLLQQRFQRDSFRAIAAAATSET